LVWGLKKSKIGFMGGCKKKGKFGQPKRVVGTS